MTLWPQINTKDTGHSSWANQVQQALGSGYPAQNASYTVFKQGNTFYARNGSTGKLDYSGTNCQTVVETAIAALPVNVLGGVTGTLAFKNGIYPFPTALAIPDYSQIMFIGESFESPYELIWLTPSQNPTAFTGGVVLKFTGSGAFISTTKQASPPPGQSGLTVSLILQNVHLFMSTTNAATALDGDGIYSVVLRNVCASYDLDQVDWQNTGPVAGSVGIRFPWNLNERLTLDNVTVYGFDIGCEFGCDHIMGGTVEVAYCTYGMKWIAPGTLIKLQTSGGTSEVRIEGNDFYCPTASKGLRCKTPDGLHIYRIRVDNSGNVVTELAE